MLIVCAMGSEKAELSRAKSNQAAKEATPSWMELTVAVY